MDNCAEAIVLAGLRPGVDGEMFNIVDDELMTSKQFLAAYKSAVGSFFIRFVSLTRWHMSRLGMGEVLTFVERSASTSF